MQGRMGLPLYVDQVRLYRSADLAETPLYAVVTPLQDGSFDAEVIDEAGNRYVQLIGYRTVALPYTVSSEAFDVLKGEAATTAAAAD